MSISVTNLGFKAAQNITQSNSYKDILFMQAYSYYIFKLLLVGYLKHCAYTTLIKLFTCKQKLFVPLKYS